VETGDAAAIVGTARIKQPDKTRRSSHEAASTFALKNSTDQTEQILPATARMVAREVKFVTDSPLEGSGFELLVPVRGERPAHPTAPVSIWAFLFSSCSASHSTEPRAYMVLGGSGLTVGLSFSASRRNHSI
jgi:hypothetical protein